MYNEKLEPQVKRDSIESISKEMSSALLDRFDAEQCLLAANYIMAYIKDNHNAEIEKLESQIRELKHRLDYFKNLI